MTRPFFSLLALAGVVAGSACSTHATPATAVAVDVPAVLSVFPAAGATGVDPTKPVVLTFNMAMRSGMELFVVVHEGSVTGPEVAGTSTWSADHSTLTFTPATALKAKTTYVVHLAPSLTGANGRTLDLASCARLGGQSVSSGMMGAAGGGMMNGSSGQGMMGDGWRASDGTYGMAFTFTTA